MHRSAEVGPAQAANEVLRALRVATAGRQSALAERWPLAADEPGLADCANHLQLLLDWLAPIEAGLSDFRDGPQDPALLAPRLRAPLLAADLAHPLLQPWLRPEPGGVSAGTTETATETTSATSSAPTALPVPVPVPAPAQPWPALANAAYRWGVVYAVEGTQLAGALLYRRVAQALAPLPLRGLMAVDPALDAADDSGVVARWQAVMRGLNHQVRQRSAVTATCQGACDALDQLLGLIDAQAGAGPLAAPGWAKGQRPLTAQPQVSRPA